MTDVGGEQAEKLLGRGVLLGGEPHGVADGEGDRARPFPESDAGFREVQGDGALVLRATLAADQTVRLQALEQGERVLDSNWRAVPRARTEIESCSQRTSITRYWG